MIDHVCLNVADLARSRAFYRRVLEPLGATLLHESATEVGFRGARGGTFWLHRREPPSTGAHLAFAAADRAAVQAFHRAALAAGGRDNGAPGPRPHYHEHYYGAFVLDPDGHNVEAVCHAPPAT
jgi:catechol 2,3-dioxygenase-like lactoylglutathione lyase family enzyme